MTRGVPHSPKLRAEVVAAVLAGTTVVAAARQYGLSKQTVSRWVAEQVNGTDGTDQRAREIDIGELIVDLLVSHVVAIQTQLQAAARPEWLEKQTAAELADLVEVERSTTIQLLAGLERIGNQQPSLGAPGPSTDA